MFRLFQILLGRREHQLDSVQLVNLACTRIVINGYDIGQGILSSQLFDHTFADYVVRQAGEGLCADDVIDSGMDQLQHLTGQEPSALSQILLYLILREQNRKIRSKIFFFSYLIPLKTLSLIAYLVL